MIFQVLVNTIGTVHNKYQKQQFISAQDYDLTARTSRVDVPIHVIAGGEDGVETESSLRIAFDKYYPGTTYSLIEGVGHLIPLEAPDRLVVAISESVANTIKVSP